MARGRCHPGDVGIHQFVAIGRHILAAKAKKINRHCERQQCEPSGCRCKR